MLYGCRYIHATVVATGGCPSCVLDTELSANISDYHARCLRSAIILE